MATVTCSTIDRARIRTGRVRMSPRGLHSVEDCLYPSCHRPLTGPSLTVKLCGFVLECEHPISHAMLINCPTCRAKVNAKELKQTSADSENGCWQYTFLQCPSCDLPMLAEQEGSLGHRAMVWDPPRRVWPEPPNFSHIIPRNVRNSLIEAARCCECGAFTASVTMTGRALEGLVRHFTDQKLLGPGILKLHEQEIIDKRLLAWANALRLDRNFAAHATGQTFSADDAEDLLAFATAICEYVFVIDHRFQKFQKRRIQSGKAD